LTHFSLREEIEQIIVGFEESSGKAITIQTQSTDTL
jgi:hypothetical protein